MYLTSTPIQVMIGFAYLGESENVSQALAALLALDVKPF